MSSLSAFGVEGGWVGRGPTAEPEDWVGDWGVEVESITGTQSLALRPRQMAAEQPRLQEDTQGESQGETMESFLKGT